MYVHLAQPHRFRRQRMCSPCSLVGATLVGTMSIPQFFSKAAELDTDTVDLTSDSGVLSLNTAAPVPTMECYLKSIMEAIDVGNISLEGQPLIRPPAPATLAKTIDKHRRSSQESRLSEEDLALLVLRPDVFVWIPHRIVPGLEIQCINCGGQVTSTEWSQVKIAHGLSKRTAYITKKYICYKCGSDRRSRLNATLADSFSPHRPRKQRKMQADSNALLESLPMRVRLFWPWYNTGQTLCHMEVVDFVRSLATRTSWSAIAQAINEMKENSWQRSVTDAYANLCEQYSLQSVNGRAQYPTALNVSDDWVRNLYMLDFADRKPSITRELKSQLGDDVLVVDWTVDAAAKCSSNYLFNVMDGRQTILLSALVPLCSPLGVQDKLLALQRRGVNPKVVYVDCECCGAWRTIITQIWHNAIVKLDAMHAMRRVTRTLTSSQHPWHGAFCAALSQAIFTSDTASIERLRAARCRAGYSSHLPGNIKSRYVPRMITNGDRISETIEAVLEKFGGGHPVAGALTTASTKDAWRELRHHVRSGCLCDPLGMQTHVFGKPVVIGGERFHIIKTRRGSSALEGFHTHQKHWLGHLARHAADAGGALLADGAVRWNRKRCLERATLSDTGGSQQEA